MPIVPVKIFFLFIKTIYLGKHLCLSSTDRRNPVCFFFGNVFIALRLNRIASYFVLRRSSWMLIFYDFLIGFHPILQ